jgi:hypothetical protein
VLLSSTHQSSKLNGPNFETLLFVNPTNTEMR